MKELFEKILEAHRLMSEVNAKVLTCGLSDEPRWHILEAEDFVKVATEIGDVDVRVDRFADDYIFKLSFTYMGIYVFCLIDPSDVEDNVANIKRYIMKEGT